MDIEVPNKDKNVLFLSSFNPAHVGDIPLHRGRHCNNEEKEENLQDGQM